ncbi:hypothetical protein ANN_24848 [Periplaneta americana]|uniref:Secreted protein n=1 Tax=Periplaneta americana TaxID=6978 RepID=A0ABQ8RZW2_PERAM|nr:hypothetical protein ANN_24848 [Periplaneta americana]
MRTARVLLGLFSLTTNTKVSFSFPQQVELGSRAYQSPWISRVPQSFEPANADKSAIARLVYRKSLSKITPTARQSAEHKAREERAAEESSARLGSSFCLDRQDSWEPSQEPCLLMSSAKLRYISVIIIIRGATAREGPRPTSQLLASRPHAEAEVNDHPTRMKVSCFSAAAAAAMALQPNLSLGFLNASLPIFSISGLRFPCPYP